MDVYVVTAYRWGNREKHSYVVGVRLTEAAALKLADTEEEYRGGGNKYQCEVLRCSHAAPHDCDPVVIRALEGRKAE